ncbi:TetR/AcrR family transcriptional regulator [Microbacterium sp. CFBP9034]|uniref:TetR/AcrR family transcriptional regulator n=1 Tax=Microbacterium sp. CFBP9034 TaxID=3096540 RepID=UPI002A6A47EE|nr:TetR/AcrR family transcriptional regulator [Microbacterium sp. CFBP9034]MDY0909933.1 TetR/AcrR family transcriptional regulator [Microbacterium sp. CFBP9034]
MREDPRQTRTREALGSALVRLLQVQPLDELSVAALCREAGVHRTTFYGHADGVDTFAVAWFTRDIDDLSAVAPAAESPRDVAGEYLHALRATLQHVAAQRTVFRAMFASGSRGALRSALEERLRSRAALAIDVLDAHGAAGLPSGGRARVEASAFIAGGLVGVIEAWTQESDDDADAAGARVLALMPRWWPLAG